MPRPDPKCDMPRAAGTLALAVLVATIIIGMVEIAVRLAEALR